MKRNRILLPRFIIFLMISLSIPVILCGQRSQEHMPRRGMNQMFLGRGNRIPFETIKLISEQPDKQRVDVLFRIPYEFMIFTRNEDTTIAYPYAGKADVTVDVLDSSGISVSREMKRVTAGTADIEDQHDPHKTVQSVFSFSLSAGTYKVITQVEDVESPRKMLDDNRVLIINNFSSDKIDVSDILFVKQRSGSSDSLQHIIPVNQGGDIPFGSRFEGYIEFVNPSPSELPLITYRLTGINREQKDTVLIVQDTLWNNELMTQRQLKQEVSGLEFFYELKASSRPGKYSAWLLFPADTMKMGEYFLDLTVHAGNKERVIRKGFSIRWYDMPRSLAIDELRYKALEYLMSKEEFQNFEKLSADEKASKFREVWKQRDPTPKTEFNEAMAEYYKRVDYSLVHFSLPKEEDGYRADRGRAYILYGPPTKTNRMLSPSGPAMEIWYYENLSKKVIFIDQNRNGDFVLQSVETM